MTTLPDAEVPKGDMDLMVKLQRKKSHNKRINVFYNKIHTLSQKNAY